MKTMRADFNARTSDNRVRIDTPLSKRAIAEVSVGPGTWVWLQDDDVRAPARLENEQVALVVWRLLEDVATDGTGSEARSRALDRVRRAFSASVPGGESQRLEAARFLGLVEKVIEPGRADYLRSRLAQQLGERELAVA